ncbi:hypothetical protein R69608_07651 [Paraburkholderia nemoris]|nr:hypothetical protein R69608_07651 [Paraburkholderia nemoris]
MVNVVAIVPWLNSIRSSSASSGKLHAAMCRSSGTCMKTGPNGFALNDPDERIALWRSQARDSAAMRVALLMDMFQFIDVRILIYPNPQGSLYCRAMVVLCWLAALVLTTDPLKDLAGKRSELVPRLLSLCLMIKSIAPEAGAPYTRPACPALRTTRNRITSHPRQLCSLESVAFRRVRRYLRARGFHKDIGS